MTGTSLLGQSIAAHPSDNATRAAEELLARPITVRLSHVSLIQALNAISRAANVAVQFQVSDVQEYRNPVTIDAVGMRLGIVLERVLDGTRLHVIQAGDGNLAIVPTDLGVKDSVPGVGQVRGTVIDSATRRPLSEVTVKIAGTKLATMAHEGGQFAIDNVPAGNQVVTARLFGYRPVEQVVTVVDGQPTTVRIVLVSVPNMLSGVVTTATGQQRKVEVGNDITTLNVDSVMRVAPITSVTDLLETRVPGLTVQHTSGVPGNPSRIRIRGASSITGNNDPIVVVDGVRVYASQSDPRNDNSAQSAIGSSSVGAQYAAPSPLDQIDPQSIETIEVLKGPSASALYGSDAANGVIVITTKHGKAGATHWDVALGTGVDWLPGRWPENYYRLGQTSDYQLGANSAGSLSAGLCLWYYTNCVVDRVVSFQALNDPRYTVFSHGDHNTVSATVSGGVPTVTYALTGTTTHDLGNLKLPAYAQDQLQTTYGALPHWMIRPDQYQTAGMTGSVTMQPSARIRVLFQSSLFSSKQQQGSLQQAVARLEGEIMRDSAGIVGVVGVNGGSFDYGVPLIPDAVERATSASITSTNMLDVHWTPWSWLPLFLTGGMNTIQRVDQTLIPYGLQTSFDNGVAAGSDTTGSYGLGRGTSLVQTLNAGTTLPSKVVTTAIGLNVVSQSINDFSAYTNQLAPGVSVPSTFPYQDGLGPTQSSVTGSTYGWYIEPRLNLSSRFFAAPGFRLDGGSASGARGGVAGSGLTGFPKIDLSYLMVDQDHPRGILTQFRPRLSFGYAGTQPDPTAKLRLLNVGGGTAVRLNDSVTAPAVVVSTIGNTAIRPETSRELEGGVDVELWSGRLTGTWTHATKTRYNAIISIPVAPSANALVGGQGQSVNVGVVRNTSTEMTLTATVVTTTALQWSVTGNYSHDDNLLVRLAHGFTPDKSLGIVAGYPLFSDWANPIIAVVDRNHDGFIEGNEYEVGDSAIFVGQSSPKAQVNFSSNLTLGGRLSINAGFSYQNGLTQQNDAALSSGAIALIPNVPGATLGTLAAVTAASCPVSCGGGRTLIGLYQTVNTFRVQSLSINYTLPPTVSQWLRVPHATMALQGENLGLHTNYRGIDPNVNAFSTSTGKDATADAGQLPEPRTWWLRLTLGN